MGVGETNRAAVIVGQGGDVGSAGSGVGAAVVGGEAGMRSAPGVSAARARAARNIGVCSELPGLRPGYRQVSGLRRWSFLRRKISSGAMLFFGRSSAAAALPAVYWASNAGMLWLGRPRTGRGSSGAWRGGSWARRGGAGRGSGSGIGVDYAGRGRA